MLNLFLTVLGNLFFFWLVAWQTCEKKESIFSLWFFWWCVLWQRYQKHKYRNHDVCFSGAAWSVTAARKAKSVPKSLKSRSAGVWKAFLGVSWTTWWQVFGEMRAKIAPRGAKMSPRGAKISQLGAKLEESCGQEAPRSTQEAHLGVMLRASWAILKAFW